MDRICNACDIKLDENYYLKNRTFCKSCYNKNRKNKNQQPKVDYTTHKKPIIKKSIENKTCHRHLIVGSSGYRKSYLMNYIRLGKQGPIFILTKSLNQYPNIKAQLSDEIQPLENYGNWKQHRCF